MNEEELYDKLERYVRGKLPSDEAVALERAIADDPDLQEQVRLHRLELESHEHLLREKLRHNVRDWIAEAPPSDPPSSIWKTWRLPLALIAFAVAGFWFIGREKADNTSKPAKQNVHKGKKPPVSTPDRPVAQDVSPKTAPDAAPYTQPDRGYLALAETNYRLPTHLDGGDLKSDSLTNSATWWTRIWAPATPSAPAYRGGLTRNRTGNLP